MRVSVIVPTKNSSNTLPRLLRSIQTQTYQPAETLIIDNQSNDGTIKVSEEFGVRIISGGPERSAQRNLGAKTSQGDTLLFLDADMELTPLVIEACANTVERGADAVCILEKSIGNGYWCRARALERSCSFGSEIFEAARFFKKPVFGEIGGYDTGLTGVEDLDIQARLVLRGYALGWASAPILHHEEDLSLFSYLRKRIYYGQSDGVYATRYPDRWKRQRSVTQRWSRLRPVLKRRETLQLLPGLAFMRGLEWLLRR